MLNQLSAFLISSASAFGLVGTSLILLACLACAILYTGKAQERYSILNHFISELGEAGVSDRAKVFNYGLIAGGALLVPFVIGFGMVLSSVWAVLATIAGVWAAVSCILVGVFPMNNLEPHVKVATSYFRSGLVMVLLFGIAILVQPPGQAKISPLASITSLLAALSYGSFLFLGRLPENTPAAPEGPNPELIPDRPQFLGLAALEWLVFLSTILWFIAAVIFLY